MHYIDFGRTGLRVSPFALGTGQLGAQKDGTIDETAAAAIVGTYLAEGGNLIDTSDAYQGGQSEEILGRCMGRYREDVVLASKYTRTADKQASPGRRGNHRKAMVQAVEGSLHRLKTDRIDVYFAHYDDGITPVEEMMRGFEDLVHAGKILYPGLSNFPAWRTAKAATTAELRGWAPLAAIEIEYNLLFRTAEREVLPFAQDAGVAVLAYSPLAAGALTGRELAGVAGEGSRAGVTCETDAQAVLRTMRAIAARLEVAAAHVALSWLVAKGTMPVLGVRTLAHLTEALPAAQVRLSSEDMKAMDTNSAISPGYPQALLAAIRKA